MKEKENPEEKPNQLELRRDVPAPPQTRPPYADRYAASRYQPGYSAEQAEMGAEESDAIHLVEYWRLLCRRKGTILLIAFLGTLAGVLLTIPQTKLYQARTVIEIQGQNADFLNMKDVDPTARNYSEQSDIQTQVKILQSNALIERALGKLPPEKLADLMAPSNKVASWKRAVGLATDQPVSKESAAKLALKRMKVSASGLTRLVEIKFESPAPQLAALFANTLVSEYIQQTVETRWQTAQRTGEWLTRQLDDLKIKLEKSEDALQSYAQSAGLMYLGADGADKDGQSNIAEEKLRQLQEELSKAQAERVLKQSNYELVTNTPPDSLPQVLDDASLRNYQEKLTDLRRTLSELATQYTPAHYKVKNVEAQIQQMQAAMDWQRSNILKRINNEYQTALKREKLLQAAYNAQGKLVSDQSAAVIHYGILKREVETNRHLYEGMLQKVKEAGIASAAQASNVNVVDPAKIPTSPSSPVLVMNSGLGLVGGLFFGIGFVLLRERVDRSIQGPGDSPLFLNIPELGVIVAGEGEPPQSLPHGRKRVLIQIGSSSTGGGKSPAAIISLENGTKERDKAVELATWFAKPSLLAESFRSTLTSLLFAGQKGQRPKVLVFTSSYPREGKSTVVSNLGIALAELREKALLIDADMRKPRLHTIFDLPNDVGLSNMQIWSNPVADWPLDEVIHPTYIPGLFVLPSGPPTTSTVGLLHSQQMTALLERLRQEYSMILIDTPPMMQMPDARIIGRLADGVVLVIRSGKTTRDEALAATQRFFDDGTAILGSILNEWNPKTHSGYGYGGYSSGYNNYYKHYYSHYGKNKNMKNGCF